MLGKTKHQGKGRKITQKQKILLISMSVSVILIITGLLLGDVAVLGNLTIIAIFVTVVPFFMYRYSGIMLMRQFEEQFPNLVRDLADSSRSGMSFSQAMTIASRSNYGKLTPEVITMKNRLSWGTPFLRVLEIFGERVKSSKLITESLLVIRQTYESGGSIPATLESVADNMIRLKEAEEERRSMVKQHVFIMYGIFFMFLGISVLIIYVLVPMMENQPDTNIEGRFSFQFSNPCCMQEDERGFCAAESPAFPCNLFGGICTMFSTPQGIGCYYVALFFSVVVIQGLFMGLIAGQLGDNSVMAGGKHSLIMLFASIGIFFFLSKIGIFAGLVL